MEQQQPQQQIPGSIANHVVNINGILSQMSRAYDILVAEVTSVKKEVEALKKEKNKEVK